MFKGFLVELSLDILFLVEMSLAFLVFMFRDFLVEISLQIFVGGNFSEFLGRDFSSDIFSERCFFLFLFDGLVSSFFG